MSKNKICIQQTEKVKCSLHAPTSIFWLRQLLQLQLKIAVFRKTLKVLLQDPGLGLDHGSFLEATGVNNEQCKTTAYLARHLGLQNAESLKWIYAVY